MKKILDCIYRVFEKVATIGSDKFLHLIAGLIVAFVLGRLLANVEAWAFSCNYWCLATDGSERVC